MQANINLHPVKGKTWKKLVKHKYNAVLCGIVPVAISEVIEHIGVPTSRIKGCCLRPLVHDSVTECIFIKHDAENIRHGYR